MTGSKVFQVWSFEFPYCVFLYKDKPRLGSILHPRYLDRGIPRNIFRVKLRGSQFVSSFDRSREILRVRITALTQKYCHSWNNTISDIKLGPTGTLIQLVKVSEKNLIAHRVPVCLDSVSHCYAKSLYCSSSLSISQSRNHLKLSGGRSIEQNVISSPKKPIPALPLVLDILDLFTSHSA